MCLTTTDVPQCAANEIYTKCAPLCPPTCEEKEPKPCLDKCLDGCVCKEGYIRSVTGGACVPEDTCDIGKTVNFSVKLLHSLFQMFVLSLIKFTKIVVPHALVPVNSHSEFVKEDAFLDVSVKRGTF